MALNTPQTVSCLESNNNNNVGMGPFTTIISPARDSGDVQTTGQNATMAKSDKEKATGVTPKTAKKLDRKM
jgi:hypothetical protein